MLRLPYAAVLLARVRCARRGMLLASVLALLAGCSGTPGVFSNNPPPSTDLQQGAAIGTGQIKVGLILPLSAAGNAGIAAVPIAPCVGVAWQPCFSRSRNARHGSGSGLAFAGFRPIRAS